MNYEFMTAGTPLPPCLPFPEALVKLPVSGTAKIMAGRKDGNAFRIPATETAFWN